MRILNGLELAEFIQLRQLHQSRSLRQSKGIASKLAIIRTGNNQVTDIYLRLKKDYGINIEIDVEVHSVADKELVSKIEELNKDNTVHGIIVQLPLTDSSLTEAALQAVSPEKDVDGLSGKSSFTPATAMAIDWLLAGYNVDLKNKKIVIVGNGRLVGAPLFALWDSPGFDVTVCDLKTVDLPEIIKQADVVVSATGSPGLISSEMIKKNAVVVDAGTASESGKIVGDLAKDVRERNDLTITPIKGGVGPLTVAALFDNVLAAANKIALLKK